MTPEKFMKPGGTENLVRGSSGISGLKPGVHFGAVAQWEKDFSRYGGRVFCFVSIIASSEACLASES